MVFRSLLALAFAVGARLIFGAVPPENVTLYVCPVMVDAVSVAADPVTDDPSATSAIRVVAPGQAAAMVSGWPFLLTTVLAFSPSAVIELDTVNPPTAPMLLNDAARP